MKKISVYTAATVVAAQLLTPVAMATDHLTLPTDHAPIGVMGDHTHGKGEWMFSYRYGRMGMEGNRDGNSEVSTASVLNDFNVAPLSMDTTMHMFGAMYGATEDVTLMAMVPYVYKTMDHITGMGTEFTTKAEGFGDVKLTSLVKLYEQKNHNIILQAGLGLPTGSVNQRDRTPMGPDQKLPYPMQLGSGTFDPIVGLTYNGRRHHWSWGSQAGTTLRLGENSEDYTLGNVYKASVWAARDLSDAFSASLRIEGRIRENIDGADPDLNTGMVPTARPDLRGGEQVDALIGVNFIKPSGKLKDHRLALEAGIPLHRNLDGPQLEADYRLMLGWQYAF